MDQQERERQSRLSSEALKYWTQGKYDEARRNWIVLAVSEDAWVRNDALTFLAKQYIDGVGVERDYKIAEEYLHKVVPNEMNKLLRAKKDIPFGKSRYLLACLSERLGDKGTQDRDKRVKLLKEAVACGDPEASYKLSLYYREGIEVEQNAKLSARYLKIAAREGNDQASQELQEARERGLLRPIWKVLAWAKERFED